MNALTQVRNTQRISRAEVSSGLSERGSWHDQFKHSAYVYAGGLHFDLTEGDLLAVFSQYGEVVDLHLVRDRETNKSKGFAFLCYEDQRSTVLAVDNLNGAKVVGRTVRVEHVGDYKKKKKELEEMEEQEELGEGRGGAAAEAKNRRVEDAGDRTQAAAGKKYPWEASDSVFNILQEAKRDIYGKGEDTPLAEDEEREKIAVAGEGEGGVGDGDGDKDTDLQPPKRRHHKHKHKHKHRHKHRHKRHKGKSSDE